MKSLVIQQLAVLEEECKRAKPDSFLKKPADLDAEEKRRTRVRELVTCIARDTGDILSDASQRDQIGALKLAIHNALDNILDASISRIRSFVVGALLSALGMIEGFTKRTDEEADLEQHVLVVLLQAVRDVYHSDAPEAEGRTAQQISDSTKISLEDATRLLCKLQGKGFVETPPEHQNNGHPTIFFISSEGQMHLEDAKQI